MLSSPQYRRMARRIAHRHLRAKFVIPPRKLKPYLAKLTKEIQSLEKELEREEIRATREGDTVTSGDSGAEELKSTLEYLYESLDPKEMSKEDLVSVRNILTEMTRLLSSSFKDIVDYLTELVEEYESPKAYAELSGLWKRELQDAIKQADLEGQRTDSVAELVYKARKEVQENLARVEQGRLGLLTRYLGNPDYALGTLLSQEGIPDSIRQTVVKLKKTVDAAGERLEALDQEKYYGDTPKHEATETLYHASVNAKSLFQTGFSLKMPGMGSGLGGGQLAKGGKTGVSFTYDLYIAKEIARSFKEAIMIANGQIKARDILDWAKRSNLLEKTIAELLIANPSREERAAKDPTSYRTPAELMLLYKAWLQANVKSGKRYNPVYLGDMRKLMQNFKGRKMSDVGVLAVSVDMTNPHISYRAQEREFRVPPEAIVSIDRLIR